MTKDEALLMAINTLCNCGLQIGGHALISPYIHETVYACKEALEQPVAELNNEYLRDTYVEGLSTNSKANEIIKTQHLYNLVEILNDPMKAYPHNFSTPAKGNALLLGLCQEAADEIEHLKAETQEPSKEEILGKVFDAVYAQYHPKAETHKPVAYYKEWEDKSGKHKDIKFEQTEGYSPLYTHPKEWQGLSDEEIDAIDFPESGTATIRDFTRAIEAKLKEKNNE